MARARSIPAFEQWSCHVSAPGRIPRFGTCRAPTMGLLTFSINVTLDGCVDHQEGIADDETHAFFTRVMGE